MIENFLDRQGRIKSWPAKREAKLAVLRYLGNHFATGLFYSEKEVNGIIEEHHTFGDYFLLRRGMIDCGVLARTQNGARYWRTSLWSETKSVTTQRLTIEPAIASDCMEIKEIHLACGYVGEWVGDPHTEQSLASMLDGTDLPPNGHREFSHVAVLRESSSGEAVGFVQYYTAWPEANSLWIGLFLLHPSRQQMGYGSEFITALIAEARRQGYQKIGLGVALRNQPGLKFWVKCGFDHIAKVKSDGESGEGSLGLLSLAMNL